MSPVFRRGYGHRFDLTEYFPPAIKTICIACVSVFVLQKLSALLFGQSGARFWETWFGLVPYAAVFGFRIWQPFTYLFLHAGVLHILFNLLYLAMFGADLERMWGARKFYIYFFLCGVGAGIINVIVKLIIDPHGHGSACGADDWSVRRDLRNSSGMCGDDAAPAGVGVSAAGDRVDANFCGGDGSD